jgi:hypothetical protein
MYVCFDQAASHISETMLVITKFNSFNELMIGSMSYRVVRFCGRVKEACTHKNGVLQQDLHLMFFN